MATVFPAQDAKRRQVVALKVLSPYVAKESQFRARFEREVRLLRRLRHPNIVPLRDFGKLGAYLYVVMPFMEAGTLRDRMHAGPLPLAVAQQVLNQVGDALQYAHSKGIVHRDIKPSNILIDHRGRALLGDFGFARVVDNSASLTGSALIGTPSYMSPEQCRGEAATPKSDQYALGVVVYHMITGELPFVSDTPMGVVILHATEPLPPPREKHPDLPSNVEAVVLRALEKDPERRFASVEAFAWAFSNAVRYPEYNGAAPATAAAAPEDATRNLPGMGARLRTAFGRRTARRRLAVVLAILLLLLLPLGFLTGASWLGANGSVRETPTGPPSEQLLATIQALGTANASQMGQGLEPGALETAVKETLAVLVEEEGGPTAETGGSPGSKSTATPTPTPTATEDTDSTAAEPSPTPTSAESGTGDATDTPTPTPTPTPTATPTPTPTPDSTATPTPTPTPTPIPAERCHKNPNAPLYCTPTPES
jgi:serine/threonine-protein kinase